MKTKLTNEEQVALIKDDLRRDLESMTGTPGVDTDWVQTAALNSYKDWCRDLIRRTDWTADQFIHNRIPPAP